MSEATPPKLSKAERLAIGTAVAGPVRQQAKAPRRVVLVGKDGAPVGVTTITEVAKSLLARSEIEFSVQEGERPDFVNCKTCGRPIKVIGTKTPSVCRPKTHKCACGKPIIGSKGVCGKGHLCRTCVLKSFLQAGTTASVNSRQVRLSERQVREAVTSRSLRAAAEFLGISSTTIRRLVKRFNIRPGEPAA